MLSVPADPCVRNTYESLQELLANTRADLTKLAMAHLESKSAYAEAMSSVAHSSCLRRGHVLQAAIASALQASGMYEIWSPHRLYGDIRVERALGVHATPRFIEIDIVAFGPGGVLHAVEVVTSLNAISSHRRKTIERRFDLASELLPGWAAEAGIGFESLSLSLVTLDDPEPEGTYGRAKVTGISAFEDLFNVRVMGCISSAMRGFDAALTPLFVELEALR